MARSEELTFRAGSVELAGTLSLPNELPAGGRHPWVLLLPSWLPRGRDGSWDREGHPGWFATGVGGTGLLRRVADTLAERGVASLRYDKRGCGASGGAWAGADLFTLIDDARDAIGAMRSRGDLDLRRTGLLGHGQGAGIALSVAIGDPAIGALTLVAPGARSERDLLRRGVAERERTGVDRMHPLVAALDRAAEELIERADRREARMTLIVDGEPVEIGLAGWEQAFHTPALALATMLHRSVTVVAGGRDAWADADESRLIVEVLRAAGNAPDLVLIAGAGHDLDEAGDAEIATLAEDLARRLEPRDLPPVLLAIEAMGDGGDPSG